ncbi:MAG: M23 family metallopeptidase [Bacteroidota bacterium]
MKFPAKIIIRCLSLYVLTCGSTNLIHAQYPSYQAPLKSPLLVTGTFGELRSNHFHAGLDFRAPIGTPVYAIADGYVSRIRITAGSYGQAIYIDHPEGYRSVYGHLNSLRDDLIDTLRQQQYAAEEFATTIYFSADDFPVRAGDQIGTVGNRGYSFGPHLHFEIRDTTADVPLNPLHFGIRVSDSRRPQLRQLMVYELDQASRPIRTHRFPLRARRDGDYQAETDQIIVGQRTIGLAIKAYDRQNAMPNWNGIYGASLRVDSLELHQFRFDSIPFESTRYLNAHVDYTEWTENTSWFHRLYRLPGDELEIYADSPYHGQFRLRADGSPSPVEIEVTDWAGNTSSMAFELVYQPTTRPASEAYQYVLLHDEANLIQTSDMYFYLPEGALYQELELQYQRVRDSSQGIYSAVHHLHSALTPLHQSGKLTIRADASLPDSLRPFALIARCVADGDPISHGGQWEEDWLEADVRAFGDYCILLDQQAPQVEVLDFRRSMRGRASFSFRISDNFATAGSARSLRYRAEVDGQWILLEFDAKSDRLTHHFDGHIAAGEHELVLRVWDDRGNETIVRREFSL